MNSNIETKIVLASSETKWTAECPHCFAQNEVDTDESLSGAASNHTCSVCHKEFTFRAGT